MMMAKDKKCWPFNINENEKIQELEQRLQYYQEQLEKEKSRNFNREESQNHEFKLFIEEFNRTLKDKLNEQSKTLTDEHNEKMEKLKTSLELQKQEIIDTREAIISKRDAEIKKLKEEHAREIMELKMLHAEAIRKKDEELKEIYNSNWQLQEDCRKRLENSIDVLRDSETAIVGSPITSGHGHESTRSVRDTDPELTTVIWTPPVRISLAQPDSVTITEVEDN